MRFQLAPHLLEEVKAPCPINGHTHLLEYLYSLEQDNTRAVAHKLECPTGRYRFLLIPEVYKAKGVMARYNRPRFGWPD